MHQYSEKVRSVRTMVVILLCLVSGCHRAQPEKGERQSARSNATVSYLNAEKCWAPRGDGANFRGAVALYETPRAHEAIIFSGLCAPEESLAGMRASSRVRVRCITGSLKGKFCKRARELDEFDEQVFSFGVKPEFPSHIYAVEGRLSDHYSVDGSGMVFRTLDISRSQELPREMIGAFIQYPKDRITLTTEYLRPGSHDAAGYRMIF